MSKHATIDMSREQTIRLIQRYGEQRFLWDKKHPKHLNIPCRRECWAKIANEFKCPVGVLKKKIASLLGSHRRELHRERKSRIRAAATGTKFYASNWFGYPYFDFLRKSKNSKLGRIRHVKPKDDSQVSDEAADEDSDASVSEQESRSTNEVERVLIRSPPQSRRTRTRPETTKEETESEYEEENTSFTQSHDYQRNASQHANDPYVIFGNYITSELRKYDPRTLACVKHAINNVIFEADLGKIPANTSDQSAHQPSQSSPSFDSKLILKISPAHSDDASSS